MDEKIKEPAHEKWIAGFWRRIGALILDALILAIVGFVLGLFLEDFFIGLGALGVLIGFSISLFYFGIQNSELANGQTLGKRIFKIRVVDENNETIGILKSCYRCFVLFIPFYLNGAALPEIFTTSIFPYLLSIIIFGGIASIIYLYIFNRSTRQSLHDLTVGTYVVNANAEEENIEEVWKLHFAITALLLIAGGMAPLYFSGMIKDFPLEQLTKARNAILENPSIVRAFVSVGKTTFRSTQSAKTESTYFRANLGLRENQVNDEKLAKTLANNLLIHYPGGLQKDSIQIILTYGYSIGIASKWISHTYIYSPKDFGSKV